MKLPKIFHGIIAVFVVLIAFSLFLKLAKSVTNISSVATEHFAWSDTSGWWDFYNTNTISAGTSSLSGYASSSIGEISLDCHTTSIGDICGVSNYQVLNPNGSGNLDGCGWNDSVGWISFKCDNAQCLASSTCAQSTYQVVIDSNGVFNNYAWNDIEGWISFNCADPGVCGVSNYKVVSSWHPGSIVGTLDSAIFDTQVTPGAILNSIIWQGSQPAGTSVKFQIAVATSSAGPWNYWGPDASCDGQGDTDQYFGPGSAGTPIVITGCNRTWVSNKRYLRYRVLLLSDTSQSLTPRVDNVVLNWSK
ncbi:MAG: hypothetical protein AAB617_02920 [Patescibacteria group bacterium]